MTSGGERPEAASARLRTALTQPVRAAIFFSIAYNILLLISPLYMLQIYDRVLTSGSIDTLLLLSTLAVAMYGVYAAADAGRKRVFALMADKIGETLEKEIFIRGMSPLGSGRRFETAVQDLGRVQSFFSSGTVQVVFDLPVSPMFYLLVFFVHPYLGWMTVVGAIVLLLLAWQTERSGKPALDDVNQREHAASNFLTAISQKFAVVTAMGMSGRLLARWQRLRASAAAAQLAAGGQTGLYGAASRSFRQMLQTLILGVAAWLVLRNEISSGAIIAASILSGRALGPIDQAIASWKPALRAQQGWRDLKLYLADVDVAEAVTPLPAPEAQIRLDALVIQVPGMPAPLLPPMSLVLPPGTILLVLGASGMGKSALLQTLAGAWPPGGGTISLGGRDLHAWASEDRGLHVGFLPQSIDLLPGTVRENIERFGAGDSAMAIAAAQAVGAHATVLQLPDGYDTPILPAGPISAGQRQLIGLARANYCNPALLLLDEPTASLDQQAAAALRDSLKALKQDRRTAIIATHDLRLLDGADYVLLLERPQPRLLSRDDFVRAAEKAKAGARTVALVP